MKYVLGKFWPNKEAWNLHRNGALDVIGFDTLREAEAAAETLSTEYGGNSVLVLTIHSCVATTTTYQPRVAVTKTERFDVPTVSPAPPQTGDGK